MFKVILGVSAMFKVMGGGVGASVMFKVILGVSAIFKVMGGGVGASVMFKVIITRGVSHVQGDGRGCRGVSHI